MFKYKAEGNKYVLDGEPKWEDSRQGKVKSKDTLPVSD